jgi:hypothetical protein
MRFDTSGQFVVAVVTPAGGWSKGRPIAVIEDADKWRIADRLIPNGLSERALESFIARKFSAFTVAGKPVRRLDRPIADAARSLSGKPRLDA